MARRHFVVSRWNFREEEKREIEAENKRKMGVGALESCILMVLSGPYYRLEANIPSTLFQQF